MKPTLNEQLARMQKIAGIIKESQVSEATFLSSLFGDKKFKGLSPYSKEEVKSYLGIDDDYEDWVELAFTKGLKFDEFEDQWYGPVKENQDYYKDAEKDDAAHIDALEKDMKDDAEHTSEGKMTKSELKAKIKEMILAELAEDSLNEDDDIEVNNPGDLNNMYSPVAEAKKDKEVEDVTIDDTEVVDAPASDMMAGESAEISGIQANLQSAYAEAKALGDEKLITQIANTITYFTKAHILDTAPVNESQINEVLQNNDLIDEIEESKKAKVDESLEILKMKKLAGLLTEGEYAKALLNETTADNVSDWDEGLYIAINKKPSPEMQTQIAKEANKEFFVDMKKIKFGENPNTGEYSVFIPFAGDYSNMMDVLKKFGIKERPYTSPHLK